MTCREFAEFLDALLAGTLPCEQVAVFDRHMAVCPHCRAYLDSYSRTIDACRRLGDRDLPPEVPDELVRAILDAHGPRG
jgi:anti-sigma factor RsiW